MRMISSAMTRNPMTASNAIMYLGIPPAAGAGGGAGGGGGGKANAGG
jgi:hypothetical protein